MDTTTDTITIQRTAITAPGKRLSFCARRRPFLVGAFAYIPSGLPVFGVPLSLGIRSSEISLKHGRIDSYSPKARLLEWGVFVAAALVAAGACGCTDQKVDQTKSVAAQFCLTLLRRPVRNPLHVRPVDNRW